MKQFSILFITFILLFSCKDSKKINEQILRDRLAGNDYERALFTINGENNKSKEIEAYISKNGDTLVNQFKLFKNGKILKSESEYYDLVISETKEPNLYKGRITLHTHYEDLKLDSKNTREINFGFCEQTKDSISLKYIETKKSNTIDFMFYNYYGKRLHGRIYQLVFRDTLINGEKMLNMRETNLIVDNLVETSNLFIEPDSIKKRRKFNQSKLKFNLRK